MVTAKKEVDINQLEVLKKVILAKLSSIQHKKFEEKSIDELSLAFRVFLLKFLKLNYEFTDEELLNELEKKHINKIISARIMQIISLLAEIKYNEKKITQSGFDNALKESIEIVMLASNMKKRSELHPVVQEKAGIFNSLIKRFFKKKEPSKEQEAAAIKEKAKVEIKKEVAAEPKTGIFDRIKSYTDKIKEDQEKKKAEKEALEKQQRILEEKRKSQLEARRAQIEEEKRKKDELKRQAELLKQQELAKKKELEIKRAEKEILEKEEKLRKEKELQTLEENRKAELEARTAQIEEAVKKRMELRKQNEILKQQMLAKEKAEKNRLERNELIEEKKKKFRQFYRKLMHRKTPEEKIFGKDAKPNIFDRIKSYTDKIKEDQEKKKAEKEALEKQKQQQILEEKRKSQLEARRAQIEEEKTKKVELRKQNKLLKQKKLAKQKEEKERLKRERLSENKKKKELYNLHSNQFRKFAEQLSKLKSAIDGDDIANSKKLYIKAREIYTGLENKEKKDVYDELLRLYSQLNKAISKNGKEDEAKKDAEADKKTTLFNKINLLGLSDNYSKYNTAIANARKAFESNDFPNARKFYGKARNLYIELDYAEKKEAYNDLLLFYSKLSEKID